MPTPTKGYYLPDGTQVPGTTTVLGALAGAPNDALLWWAVKLERRGLNWEEQRRRAADVGTLIHDILEKFPDPMPACPSWVTGAEWQRAKSAYEAFAAWDADVQPVEVAKEVQLVSVRHQAGGTFDRIDRIGGTLVIIDHKTGKHVDKKKVAAQLAAYADMALETGLVKEPIREGLILHYPEGKFFPIRISEQEMDSGLELFKVARQAYRLFQEWPR